MILALLTLMSAAQSYRAPFSDAHYGYFYPTAYYDHSGRDWACGRIRYSGHRGSDFGGGSFSGMDAGRDIVAAADGTVVAVHDGEYDRCTSGGCSGGGGYGNYVRIRHADGKHTIYAHLKKWSLTVRSGQRVSCGQKIGRMGSSGYSTGPHLHFETRTSSGARVDPFDGSCSSPPSYWVSQGPHGGRPSRTCHSTDRDGDGYSDKVDCNDRNASIHPGAKEVCDDGIDQDCNGKDRRSTVVYVDGDRDGWGGASRRICRSRRTGEVTRDGDCDDGRASVNPAAPEVCDGLDNDCDGTSDEGNPETLGEPPPPLAARIVDASLPSALGAGETAEAWLVVRNVGAETWEPRDVWLMAGHSGVRDEVSWAAHDVPAVLEERVEVGALGRLQATLRAPDEAGAHLRETWSLASAEGEAIRCPVGSVDLDLHVLDAPEPPRAPALLREAAPGPARLAGGCSTVPAATWLVLLPALLVLSRRRHA